MKLLLHCCCGPCTTGSLPQFMDKDYQPFGFFYNPNIQPFQEHQARRDSFIQLMKLRHLPYTVVEEYPLESWLSQVASAPQNRCNYCYTSRLGKAVDFAISHGFEKFSSTLLISPYQKHDLVREIGERLAKERGLEFVYLDLRNGFRAGQKKAREIGLYMQKYCGCIYSEKERYYKKNEGAMR